MPLPPPIFAAKKRRHHKRRVVVTAATPVEALVLVAAMYEPGTYVALTFGRAIDISAIDVAAITVNDGVIQGFRYVGVAASMDGPATVVVELNGVEDSADPVTQLSASADNGIVAAGDAAGWAGATDVALPFP